MVLTVNNNTPASIALQNLNATNRELNITNNRISTGFKVNGPKDDASTYSIAQKMRAEIAGLGAIDTSLANGGSVTDTAIAGGKAISDLLIEMKAKVVAGQQDGLDDATKTALQDDFNALSDQIDNIVASSEFNGTNLIDGSTTSFDVLSRIDSTNNAQFINVVGENLDADSLSVGQASVGDADAVTEQATLTAVEAAIDTVNARLAALGSSGKQIEIQAEFNSKLQTILDAGVGNLVNADMAEESAKLQALQIKQQLGVQSLSIASSSPQLILGLFG
jgi:flagellin